MSDSNFGLLLQIGDGATPVETFTTIGEVIELGIPEILTEAIETTNHSSSGWKEKIPSGLKELSGFDATLEFDQAVFEILYDAIDNKSIDNYRIVWADTLIEVWSFAAFPSAIKADKANAQSPDHLKFTVTFVPTGAPSFSPLT
jgi:hypothetical protein